MTHSQELLKRAGAGGFCRTSAQVDVCSSVSTATSHLHDERGGKRRGERGRGGGRELRPVTRRKKLICFVLGFFANQPSDELAFSNCTLLFLFFFCPKRAVVFCSSRTNPGGGGGGGGHDVSFLAGDQKYLLRTNAEHTQRFRLWTVTLFRGYKQTNLLPAAKQKRNLQAAKETFTIGPTFRHASELTCTRSATFPLNAKLVG